MESSTSTIFFDLLARSHKFGRQGGMEDGDDDDEGGSGAGYYGGTSYGDDDDDDDDEDYEEGDGKFKL